MRHAAVSLTIVVVVLSMASSARAVVLPAGFTDSFVAAVPAPTALSFAPDGRMLVTTQGGTLYVAQPPGEPVPALDLSARVCSASERGLLGVAVDPGFASNRFIYLYYTASVSGTCVNRTSRFTLNALNLVDPASELILVDNIPSPAGNHNGGDLQFGKDGYLYISVGDGGCDYAGSGCGGANDAARDEHVLLGKILRITGDGGIPETNPFQGPDSVRCNVAGRTDPGKRCQETFAWGLRNPFRIAFDPNAAGTRFYINDVGQNTWEEIDEGQAGADYGWNLREGFCATGSTTDCGPPPAGTTNPIFAYGRSDGCGSITGGAFAPTGLWPAPYDGAYFFADYVCGKIFRLVPLADGTFSRVDFASGLGGSSAVAMTFGPSGSTQALYYTTYAGGGQIRKISYAPPPPPENHPPAAVLTADVTSGPSPLKVVFDGSRSSDPDPGDTLTYIWTFGDGSPTTETTSPTVTHEYSVVGVITASLTVRDDKGATSEPATLPIEVLGVAPVATIVSPTTGDRFRVGQTITLHGIATDGLGIPLPASSLSWTVILHHGTHTHPFLGPTAGNDIAFTAPAPEDLAAASTSYLEIRLTATDAQGLTQTVTQDLQANRVELTFATSPAGLQLQVNGDTITGPTTVTSWEGWMLSVGAPTPQTDGSGRTWLFTSWSDGGAATHSIETPASAATYTATFLTPPHNTTAPAVVGDPRVGQTLAAREGTWIGSDPLVLTYQWLRCDRNGESCEAIADGISATYTPLPDDFGLTLRLEVTAWNPVGSTSVTSQPTSRVKHACSSSDCT